MLRKILITLALSSTLIGCSHISGGISPSNIPLEPGSYRTLGKAVGGDCQYKLLGIIPLSNGNETHVALEDALKLLETDLNDKNVDDIDGHIEVVNSIWNEISNRLYQETKSQEEAQSDGSEPINDTEDVQNAEYETVKETKE